MTKLYRGPDTLAVLVARSALLEVGYTEFGWEVYANRAGMPSMDPDLPVKNAHKVKAFALGHQAMGHYVPFASVDRGIVCLTCNPELWSNL